jgi:hypothetical protein
MQEIINCPGCQRKLRIPEELLGQDVQCPTCNKTFQATLEQPPAPRPREESADYREEPTEKRPVRRKRRRYDDDYDDDYEDDRYRERRRDLEPHRGGMILTLGILSIVLGIFGLILGPLAWIFGNQDMAEIQEGRMDPDGEGSTNAGRICGIIGTILSIVWTASCCMYWVFVATLVGTMRHF